MSGFDLIVAKFEEAPAPGKLFVAEERGGDQVEALASDALLGFEAEGLGAVGEEIGTCDFALDQHGVAGAFPADSVRHLAADAGLLGENYAAAVAAQPMDGFRDQLGVGHGPLFCSCWSAALESGWEATGGLAALQRQNLYHRGHGGSQGSSLSF